MMTACLSTRAFEIALQNLAQKSNVLLSVSDDAMSGMRHQRIIHDAARNETPEEAWRAMQSQGALSGTHLHIKVNHDPMGYLTQLYWKSSK
jgi:hypothetical protein